MNDILTKPTPWKTQIYNLDIDKQLTFNIDGYDYVKNLVFGHARKDHSERKFKMKTALDRKTFTVTRLQDRTV